jgi:tRNA (adenine57-N1/adenine58-N1)-methyltransferase
MVEKTTKEETFDKILMSPSGKKLFVKDSSKDFHCEYGMIKADDMKNDEVTTNKGKVLSCFDPSFADLYRKIKRGAQIIPLKDIGLILAETGVNNKSICVDAGSGSGALSIMLALHAKKVYSYDVRDDHIKITKENREFLGIKNLEIEKHDIYESIPVKDVDIITLDVPEPWLAIDNAKKALKLGGFLVSYSPSIPQLMDFVNAIDANDGFVHLKAVEITEREWEVEGRKVRPKTQGLGHSGFMAFARKVKN